MTETKCFNCKHIFPDFELKQIERKNSIRYFCEECFSGYEFTTYGKYVRLLRFVNYLSDKDNVDVIRCISCEAFTVLREIGE